MATQSLFTALDEVAQTRADAPAVWFRDFAADQTAVDRRYTFAQLRHLVIHVGALIAAQTSEGDRVAIAAPPGVDYPLAYFAVLAGGCVAVPLGVPEYGKTDQFGACLRDAAPTLVLTVSEYTGFVAGVCADQRVSSVRAVIAIDEILGAQGDLADLDSARTQLPPVRAGDDVAHLIYTSGSTGAPSGVVGTHASVLANVAECRDAYGLGAESVAVSWLPFSFAMTLYLKMLGPLLAGGQGVYLAAGDYVAQPIRWLQLMHDASATLSGAPNFGYERLLRAVDGVDLGALDLSRLQTLINGGERMNPDTMAATQAALSVCGLPTTASTPTYGITEASLSATKPLGTPYVVAAFDRDRLERGEVTDPIGAATRLVSCGAPTGQTVAIVDPRTDDPADASQAVSAKDGVTGEIWLSGASIAAGYWERVEKTAASFVTTGSDPLLAGRRWLRTGDLGFLADGELFIAGRLKEVVIVNGRNIHPPDVESAINDVAGVFACAVYGFVHDETEQVGVVVECAEPSDDLTTAVRRTVARAFDCAVGRIDLLGHNEIPRTTNGKVSRAACRRLFAAAPVG